MEQQLTDNLRAVLKEAEALLDTTSNASDGKLQAARKRLTESIHAARSHWNRLQDRTTEAAEAAGRVIKEHPYETVGAGLLAAAFLTGALWVWRSVR